MRKTVTVKLNRPRDPHAASLRCFRGIRFDEKRLAIQTLQAWQEVWNWRREIDNDDQDFDLDED